MMKFLIVDDDDQIRDVLAVGLQLCWPDTTILAAATGEQAMELFQAHEPELVLLDLALPGISGLDVLRSIRAASDVPVIMLTARGEEIDQVRGLEAGADDYVVKPFGHQALVARIRAVLRRAELPPPARVAPDFAAGDLAIDFGARRVMRAGRPVDLTPGEYRLLVQLVRFSGRVLPHRVLLTHVWGPDFPATTDNLKVLISRLRTKIEAPDGPRFIETERGVGYRFVRPAESTRPPHHAGESLRDQSPQRP
jgi:DNA-binding response OmpR family regulator